MALTLGLGVTVVRPALAQADCTPESEPNDTELTASQFQGALCVEGVLLDGDQDLVIWDLPASQASTLWQVEVDGMPGVLTSLKVFEITSEPGVEPVVANGASILDVGKDPGQEGPSTQDGILLPVGRYLLGISRSDIQDDRPDTDATYRYSFQPSEELPPTGDLEPNDDDATASPVSGAFAVSGDLGGSTDSYAWTVDATTPRWDLEFAVPLGDPATIDVHAADGSMVAALSETTVARLFDLALVPGAYRIRLSPAAQEGARPYLLRATPSEGDGDAEPDDETSTALPLTDGQPMRGRLATHGDRDRYRLVVPPGDSSLRDARLLWKSDAERRLCLLDDADQPVVCRSGTDDAALPALHLPPGEHVFEVAGNADPEDPYVLRVDPAGPAPLDFEAEPNDELTAATTLDPAIGIHGRGEPADVDMYRLQVDGDPQLWRIDLAGEDIDGLSWVRRNGTELEQASIDADGTSASLEDLYLVPGQHWFSVRVDGQEYSLAATPLGPPDPDGEREPNGDSVLAESYRIGQRKVGRLASLGDEDVYRFTLAAPSHVRLTLKQPSDGAIDLRLVRGSDTLAQISDLATGGTFDWDLELSPGDHLLELGASTPSEGTYELTSERLDPFELAADQEPNDDPTTARPVPASLSWDGVGSWGVDDDWYTVPPVKGAEPLRVTLSDPDGRVRLSAGDTQLSLDRDESGAFVATDAPVGEPLDLFVGAMGPYHVEISGGGLVPGVDPARLPLEIAWELPDEPVAAYWTDAQRLDGELRLTNHGSDVLDLALDATTSHYLWSATLAETVVSVPPGGSVSVPASVSIAADAWAGEPVLASARARTSSGDAASGSVELVATGDGAPTNTTPYWPLPDQLLGGLDAAFTGFGAVPGDTVDSQQEPALFDGITPDGGGFAVQVSKMPLELTVDLAGEAPLPIAGIILDPLARDSRLSDTPAEFELELSLDGTTWLPVLRGRVEPLPIEQPFVLEQPQDARFARLRILSRYGGGAGYIALGEWKVVASPGTPLSDEPMDIAAPGIGGHVVMSRPFSGGQEDGPKSLDTELTRETVLLGDDPAFELVIGFRDGRAARLERLTWQDPDASDAATRLDSVDVAVSSQSPLGPWTDLGSWPLMRAPDGTVSPFEMAEPTWARYVRLSGEAPPDAREIELPGDLGVIESPADATYRSVVGEWGEASSHGPFERLVPPQTIEWDPSVDAADTAADATPLAAGPGVTDRVEIDVDDDWYAIDVPPGMSGLEFAVEGRPTVGVALSLFDLAGQELPMAIIRQPDGSVQYQARVEPGGQYRLRVHQPPFSAVFAFDTSGSMGPYLDIVMQGMRTFASEIQPGREAVMIVPFEDPPVLPAWEDDPWVLQDAVNNLVTVNSSSGAEAGLLEATKLLSDREGARAVLLVTDAETSTYALGRELWDALLIGHPTVFAVHIGATAQPVEARELMQDWAAAGGGQYTYPTTHGAMDRAFDRMATWLRRPAVYRLGYEAVNLDPGTLSVLAPADGGAVALAPGVGIEIILDTSSSMNDRLAGVPRIEIAKRSLDRLVSEALPDGVPIALRAFGSKRESRKARCQTRLVQPLAPLDRGRVRRQIAELKAAKRTATPIASALAQVADDLSAVTGTRSIVLVTDGDETCHGDPAAEIAALREAGVDVAVNIVGFALEDPELKARMAEWADIGGGTYFDAAGADALVGALSAAIGAPFRIYGPDGEVHDGGTVGGGPIAVDPGTYRVEVLSDPPVEFDEVVVGGGGSIVLELPAAGEDG